MPLLRNALLRRANLPERRLSQHAARPNWIRFGMVLIAFVSALRSIQAVAATIPITALAFSVNGQHLFASGHHSIRVYSIIERKWQRTIPCGLARVQSIAVHPQANLLAAGGGVPGSNGTFELIELKTGRVTFTATNHSDVVAALAFNPDGRRLVAASRDAIAAVWDVDINAGTAAMRLPLNGHIGPVLAAAYSADDRVIASAGADRSIKVWEPETGCLIRSLNHHTAAVHCLAFRPLAALSDAAPRPGFCASGSDDLTVRVWQPEIGRMVRIVRNHEGPLFAVAYSRNGSLLFSAGKEGIVRVIDSDSDEIVCQWTASRDWIYALAASPDRQTLATGDWAGTVSLWNIVKGERLPMGD